MRLPIVLPMVVFALWIVGIVPLHSLLPAALFGLAAVGMLEAALIIEPPRSQTDPGAMVPDHPPAGYPRAGERTRVLIVGVSASAQRAARAIESSGEHEVVGFAADHSKALEILTLTLPHVWNALRSPRYELRK